ncbi:MAG TPA: hypothetical protein VIE43_07625 [Thermoanaerobaculia bacterium]|jgi:hypothetical protein|nr:hypothetical protein [Thermoanaerobaculia bacterium]
MKDPLPSADGFVVDVLVPLEKYKQLLEDLQTLAVVAEGRAEAAVSLEEVKERLKRDGLL